MGSDPVFRRGVALLCRQHDGIDFLLAHGSFECDHHGNSEPVGASVVTQALVEPIPRDVPDEEVLRRDHGIAGRDKPGAIGTLLAAA